MNVDPLKTSLNLPRFRFILSYPQWNYFQATIRSTRAYESGLEACLRLLTFAESHRNELTEQEYSVYLQRLYLMVLDMLDKLDRWEEYASVWDSLRANANLTFLQPHRTPDFGMEPFTLSKNDKSIQVHFLWFRADRRNVIGRKIERLRQGKKLGNLLHSQQHELSQAEIHRRFERVKEIIVWAERMRTATRKA